MIKKIFSFFILCISLSSYSETVFSVGYIHDIDVESSYDLSHTKDYFTTITISDVNFINNEYNNLFIQIGLSSHLFHEKFSNNKEQFLYNLGLTIPINRTSYSNIGMGFYSSHTRLKNDINVEKEKFLNLHFDYNKLITKKIFAGISFDTSIKRIGFNIGYKIQ